LDGGHPKSKYVNTIDPFMRFKICGELLIAKYGETNAGATCIEFYRAIPQEGVEAANERRKPVPVGEIQMDRTNKIPSNYRFVLLERDIRPGVVTSLRPIELPERVSFEIIRESKTGMHHTGSRYTLQCYPDCSIEFGLREWTWDTPERGLPKN
jgi:hypothetical protein